MRVLIELRHTRELYTAAVDLQPAATAVYELAAIEGVEVDGSYPPARLPLWERLEEAAPYVTAASLLEPDACAYVLRASIPDDGERVYQQLSSRPDVVGVFSDPTVETCLVCPGDPALGDDNDVADLLDVKTLAAGSLDGTGVRVAVVDTGINMSHLQSMGRTQGLDVANSWTPSGVPTTAGAHPVGHGTMCAFDVGIAAPNAPLLDYAVLLSRTPGATAMSGLLSDAVLAYAQLLSLLSTGTFETLVVTNSWGMFSPTWDFPTGHTGNYSDNPAHPFNVLVASLERAGADICFAAGNCGRDCPDDRCGFSGGPSICGANSHEAITTVAGIDTGHARVGYSSQGPGRLARYKPDICGYTHFRGSMVYPADQGTSAACPVIAGLLAAVRTICPPSQLLPAQLRALMAKTAIDLSGKCFDFDHGSGYPDVPALAAAVQRVAAGAPPPVP